MARCLWTGAGCFRKLCSPVLGCGVVSLVILKSFFERNSSFHPRDDNGARKVMLEVSDSSKLCQNPRLLATVTWTAARTPPEA